MAEDYGAFSDEVARLTAEADQWHAQLQEAQDNLKRIRARREVIQSELFEERFTAGFYQSLDRERYEQLQKDMHGGGMDVFRKGREVIDKIHPSISNAGMFTEGTGERWWQIKLDYSDVVDGALMAAVLRTSSWTRVGDGPAHWQIFEHTLSVSGVYGLEVWEDGTARISKITYGRESETLPRCDLKVALEYIREKLWYGDGPPGHEYEDGHNEW